MSEAHTERAHARLSPSAAHRWIACPGSVVLEELAGDRPSGAAANEGTAAHELGAWALQMARDPADMLGRVVDITAKEFHTRFLMPGAPVDGLMRWPVTDEMVEAVTLYVDHVRSLGDERVIEERLDISHVNPGIWGTGDAIVLDRGSKTLHVVDLKYGRGVVVEAEDNPQALLYASGALRRFHNVAEIDTVAIHIVQPRADHPDGRIRTWVLPAEGVEQRAATIGDAATAADEARARYMADPQTKAGEQLAAGWARQYLQPGEHCRFCAVGPTCPARRQAVLAEAQAEFDDATGEITLPDPTKLPPETLAKLVGAAREMQHWIKSVEEYAHAEATAGRVPPGFKLVAKRANRVWKDEAALLAAAPMLLSVNMSELYGEPKLLSPAQVEKKLPKDERDLLDSFITRSSSGTNLVPVADGRDPARMSATDEFAD